MHWEVFPLILLFGRVCEGLVFSLCACVCVLYNLRTNNYWIAYFKRLTFIVYKDISKSPSISGLPLFLEGYRVYQVTPTMVSLQLQPLSPQSSSFWGLLILLVTGPSRRSKYHFDRPKCQAHFCEFLSSSRSCTGNSEELVSFQWF